MIWEAKYGKFAGQIQAQAAANNRPTGDGLASCPEIGEDILFYWEAYQDLGTERPPGGYYTIPFFKIVEYARLYDTDVGTLKLIIWKADEQYLGYLKEAAESDKNSKRPVDPRQHRSSL